MTFTTTITKKRITFEDADVGDWFMHSGHFYIKIFPWHVERNCVSLENGCMKWLSPDEEILLVSRDFKVNVSTEKLVKYIEKRS